MTGAVKVVRLLTRRADISHDEFAARWTHAAHQLAGISATNGGVTAYISSMPVGDDSPIANAPAAPFDGADELWCDDLETATALFASQSFQSVARAEAAIVDPTASAAVVGHPLVAWERPPLRPDNAIVAMIMPARRGDLTVDAFRHHWIEIHVPLALQFDEARQHVQRIELCPADLHPIAGLPAADFDGIGTLAFDRADDLIAEFSSEHYHSQLQEDERRFTDPDRSRAMLCRQLTAWRGPH
jgi:hypothetical protein